MNKQSSRYSIDEPGPDEVFRATLVIDKQDRLVSDLDHQLRLAWGDEVLDFS